MYCANNNKNYGSWTIKDLKDELRKRKAKLSGKKNDLVERLESYDRNQNFTDPDTTVTGKDYQMKLPTCTTYRDINSDTLFPPFTEADIAAYLCQYDKSITQDAKDMYNERFLRFFRISTDNQLLHIQSECMAQMKKKLSYKIDISVMENGQVVESQCECAAGMGPGAHCKHVCCLLFALYKFSSKKEIRTEETCTELLQTFHHCKKFKGSPIKCSQLNFNTTNENNATVNYDPRPLHLRNMASYPSFFQNHCVSSTFSNIPFQQCFPPANIHAASHDHDYLAVTPEETFLREHCISAIDTATILEIEQQTRAQSKCSLWRTERTKRINSSNFGTICKFTERADQKKFAHSLTMQKQLNTAPINHGRKYEHVAIKMYGDQANVSVAKCGTYISSNKPYLASSPDGLILENGVLEVKCPYVARDKAITPVTVPYLEEFNKKLQLQHEHAYYYQVQGQLYCTNRHYCDFCVYTFTDFKVIRIIRNDEFINQMLEKLDKFYNLFFKEAVLATHFYKQYYKYNFNN